MTDLEKWEHLRLYQAAEGTEKLKCYAGHGVLEARLNDTGPVMVCAKCGYVLDKIPRSVWDAKVRRGVLWA